MIGKTLLVVMLALLMVTRLLLAGTLAAWAALQYMIHAYDIRCSTKVAFMSL